jgi:cation/acetate symporter
LIARLLVLTLAAGAAWLTHGSAVGALTLIGWALAFAAAGTFVPLLLGIWWRDCTAPAALAGIGVSFGIVTLMFVLELSAGAEDNRGDLGPIEAAALAMAAGFLVTVLTSVVDRRNEHRAAG